MRMEVSQLVGVGLLGALGVFAGCTEGERRLPTPDFESRRAVPGVEESSESSEGGEQSNFEEAIRESQSQGDESKGATRSQQLVPMGSGFAGEIPVKFDAWQWAADPSSSLVVYAETGSRPQAVIYAEDFSDFGRTFPSLELDRFLVGVDPGFRGSVTVPQAFGDGLGEVASDYDLPAAEMLSGVLRGSSRTLGLGLRYQSRPESFTGWRWIGSNDQGVTIRAARTRGRFGLPAAPGRESSGMFGRLRGKVSEMERAQSSLSGLRKSLDAAGPADAEQAARGGPGWMLVAQVEADASRAIHLAVACERPCPVADELAHFLGSIRLRTEAESRLSGASSPDIVELAHEHGFPLVDSGDVPSLAKSVRELTGGAVGGEGRSGESTGGSGPSGGVPDSKAIEKSLQKLKGL